jgi:hypothetical protein
VASASGSVRTCYYLHWLCALARREEVSTISGEPGLLHNLLDVTAAK